jgi:HK97 family phage major capsid protein
MAIKQELVEKRGELKAKRKKLHEIFAEAGSDLDMSKVKSLGDMPDSQKVEEVRKLSKAADDLGAEVERLAGIVKAQENDEAHQKGITQPDDPEPQGGESRKRKSFGDLFVESDAFKAFGEDHERNKVSTLDISLKTLFETGAGWEPEATRTGRLVEYATRPIQVMDLIPMGQTGQNAVVYMEETTFTNTASPTDEAGTYPEATLELTERTSPVRKIAVWLPVTDEQLEDVAQARNYVQNRLRFMIRQAIDNQILNGDGSSPNLTGILEVTGLQSRAKGTDPTPDAIYKAMIDVMVNGQAEPNAIVMNPRDWQAVRLLRTSDGVYIWGNPADSGPERMWGTQMVRAQVLGAGTALTGDFANFVEWTERRGIDVQITNAHSDFFINGKQAIRADVRAAMPIYRPSAFSEITGI